MHLLVVGRKFYGVCLIGLGIQQLIYANFLPMMLPEWPSWFAGVSLWAYLFGVLLIASGASMLFEKFARTIALISGGVFLLLFLCCHVPHLIFFNPYSNYLGTWTHALKLLALSGGAFALAGSYDRDEPLLPFIKLLERLVPFDRIFFSITMIAFGIDHFLYVEMVAKLVPDWIPGHTFWTYFAAVALIGSGIAIILKIQLKLVAILLGTMIFLWFVLLHIPRAIADPSGNMGNEVTSAIQALGFSGIAIMIAYGKKTSA